MSHLSKKLGESKNKLLAISAIVLVMLGAGAFAIYQSYGGGKTGAGNSVDYSPASPADNKTSEERKDQSLQSAGPNGNSPAPSASAMVIRITGANVQSGNVHIGTLVAGTKTGGCVLTASRAGQKSQQLGASAVRLNVNTYDCGVFNIPVTVFPSSGTWQLSLTVTNGVDKATGTYDVTIP